MTRRTALAARDRACQLAIIPTSLPPYFRRRFNDLLTLVTPAEPQNRIGKIRVGEQGLEPCSDEGLKLA